MATITTVALASVAYPAAASAHSMSDSNFYLPDAAASKTVSVSRADNAQAGVIVMTEAIAIKESGPKQTVAKFGEVYAFSPNFIGIQRDVPTAITFWNLQPDDEHDFMLAAPDSSVLMHAKLPPLSKTSFVFTFHKEGLYNFYCGMHQPEMNGQILVTAPAH
ncbi:MAG TPA: cupredoxin domain-containing protein [Candidatus Binataceae bacterium]|nr:cupredoxin domain-containing protein [Candidatus Binataceae bacterium]